MCGEDPLHSEPANGSPQHLSVQDPTAPNPSPQYLWLFKDLSTRERKTSFLQDLV